MARFEDLPVELQEEIWKHAAEGTIVVVAHKKFPGTSNKIPSICGPTSRYAYSTESAAIIQAVQLKLVLEGRVEIYINVLNFDFTNFIRLIKYCTTNPGDKTTPRGDITRLGGIWEGRDFTTVMVCRHRITSSLERDSAKLATYIKFTNTLHKNTGVGIGAAHRLLSVEDSPALWEMSKSQLIDDHEFGSQAMLIEVGLHNWRMEAQWIMQYGSVREGQRQNGCNLRNQE